MSMIHNITAGAQKNKISKRKGRGESSGKGKTCGRGTKGSGAHGGDVAWKRGHEGGQTPIHRRLPKRGFSNDPFANPFYVVNLSSLQKFKDGSTIDAAALMEAGLIQDTKLPVKILGDGELTNKLTVTADWFSKSAQQKITSAGGQALNAEGKPFEFPKPKKIFVLKEDPKKAKKSEAAPAEAPAEAPKA